MNPSPAWRRPARWSRTSRQFGQIERAQPAAAAQSPCLLSRLRPLQTDRAHPHADSTTRDRSHQPVRPSSMKFNLGGQSRWLAVAVQVNTAVLDHLRLTGPPRERLVNNHQRGPVHTAQGLDLLLNPFAQLADLALMLASRRTFPAWLAARAALRRGATLNCADSLHVDHRQSRYSGRVLRQIPNPIFGRVR